MKVRKLKREMSIIKNQMRKIAKKLGNVSWLTDSTAWYLDKGVKTAFYDRRTGERIPM